MHAVLCQLLAADHCQQCFRGRSFPQGCHSSALLAEFPCHCNPDAGAQELETHLCLSWRMQGESIAAQPATLLTGLTGLATLQLRRCGHWQEVRCIDILTRNPGPAAALSPPAAQLAACAIKQPRQCWH